MGAAGFVLMGMVLAQSAYGSRWEYVKTYEGVDLYQALQTGEGKLPFRATADLDVPYQKIVMALVDVERKNDWAPKLKEATIHAQYSPMNLNTANTTRRPGLSKIGNFSCGGPLLIMRVRYCLQPSIL